MTNAIPTTLFVLPIFGAPLVYLAGRAAKSPFLARWTARILLLLTWIPWIQLLLNSLETGNTVVVQLQALSLRVDGLGLLLSGATILLGTAVAFYSGPYMRQEEGEEKYYALLLLLVGSITGLACAADLFNLWLWFEAMAISTYFLVAFYRREEASLEAGMKYLVQSAAGSALVLFGIALVFASAGTLDLAALPAAIRGVTNLLPLQAAGALFLIGFGVKAALVPMHTWLPDAHAQAPSGISAMLSGVVIEAGLVALLRSLGPLASVSYLWGTLLLAIGAANMLYGNLMALRQTQVKRLLAFSSLSHTGYMLLGLGAALIFAQPDAAAGSFFHLVTHMLMKGTAFLGVGALLYTLFLSQGRHDPLTVADLNGAASRYPAIAFAVSIALLGLGGLPPLAGFMSKWQIFIGSVETRNVWVIALVVFAAFNSVLSLAYYAPIVNALYRKQASPAVLAGRPAAPALAVPVALLAIAIVVLGVAPTLISPLTQSAANVFLALGR